MGPTVRTVDRYLEYLSRPPGYQKALHLLNRLRPGENLLLREWDVCIVLDACRADLMREIYGDEWIPPFGGRFDTLFSMDSATEPWMEKTFDEVVMGPQDPITYVSANPYSSMLREIDVVGRLDEVWRYGWDDRLKTVPPRAVTDRAITNFRDGDDRMVVHYIQPHIPYLTSAGEELHPHPITEGTDWLDSADIGEEWRRGEDAVNSMFDRLPGEWNLRWTIGNDVFSLLRRGDLAVEDVWQAYRETLLVVLDQVDILLQSIDADTVALTSDHGNAFGEWGLYGHPFHMPFSVLREVPYIRTSAEDVLDYQPDTYDSESDLDRDEKLAALGYL